MTEYELQEPPSLRHISQTWLPLAVSSVLMSVEATMITAFVARFPNPEISLAAFGGIVRATTFAIESPLLMLITASVTLSKDWQSYQKLRKYAFWGIGTMTALHAAIAFTPLYDFLAIDLISAPPQVVQPGRWGLMLTVPYLAAVAYRRLNQGVLIRFGHSKAIMFGTSLRLPVTAVVLTAGLMTGSVPGAIVGSAAMTVGVWSEAIYVTLRARPLLTGQLRRTRALDEPLSLKVFLKFYPHLAMASVAMLVMMPVTSAALSRMPNPVLSLAVWEPVLGAVMVFGSGGTAVVDVVVSLLDRTRALPRLRRFAFLLAGVTGLTFVGLGFYPIGVLWYGTMLGLGQPLLGIALRATLLVLPFPVARVLEGLFRGMVTYERSTRAVTEAVVISSLVSVLVFGMGVVSGEVVGAYVGALGFATGAIAQALWMWYRSRSVAAVIQGRDALRRMAEMSSS